MIFFVKIKKSTIKVVKIVRMTYTKNVEKMNVRFFPSYTYIKEVSTMTKLYFIFCTFVFFLVALLSLLAVIVHKQDSGHLVWPYQVAFSYYILILYTPTIKNDKKSHFQILSFCDFYFFYNYWNPHTTSTFPLFSSPYLPEIFSFKNTPVFISETTIRSKISKNLTYSSILIENVQPFKTAFHSTTSR